MKKLSILKKELYLNLGIGINSLILGIIPYTHLSKNISVVLECICLIAILSTLIPFFRKTESDDELSESIRNEACMLTLKIGLIIIMILAAAIKFAPIYTAVMNEGLIYLIVAFFFIFYCINFTILSKQYEKSDDEVIEE